MLLELCEGLNVYMSEYLFAFIAQSVECSLGKAEVTGSIPVKGSNDVSVRTKRTDRYKNQSVKWLIFSFAKNHPNSI